MPRPAGTVLAEAEARLRRAGVEEPRREALLLLAHALGCDRAALRLHPEREVEEAGFATLLARRAAREPMAFLTGRQGFWSLELEVSRATLIPRADSETLIEAASAAFPERGRVRSVLDLGAGTGALLLAALREFPGAFGVGVDLAPDAAALARRNAERNGLAGRAAFLAGDWLEALAGFFDLVLANPPYIPSGDIAALMPEVRGHEPAMALDGGADGLDAYRRILAAVPRRLAPGGALVLELGAGQAPAVAALAGSEGFRAEGRRDCGGVVRALTLRRTTG